MMQVELTETGELEGLSLVGEAFTHARAGAALVLDALVGCGVPVDIRNEHGDSLLMLAVSNGHLDAARILLAHGADPELCNNRGLTPMQVASVREDDALVILMLENCFPRASAA